MYKVPLVHQPRKNQSTVFTSVIYPQSYASYGATGVVKQRFSMAIKGTSAASVMKTIHLESWTSNEWRTSGPQRPCTCRIQGSLIYPVFHRRIWNLVSVFQCSAEALC